jgi:hypothetical protein
MNRGVGGKEEGKGNGGVGITEGRGEGGEGRRRVIVGRDWGTKGR